MIQSQQLQFKRVAQATGYNVLMSVPDYAADSLEPACLPALLRTRGAVCLRELFSESEISAWLPAFEAAYVGSDFRFQTGQMDAGTYASYYQYGHADPREARAYAGWLEMLQSRSRLQELLGAVFGERALLLCRNSVPRRQSPERPEQAIAFHQDQEFMGPMHQAVNLWLPLTPAGGDYPGIEIWLDGPLYPLLSLDLSEPERQRCLQDMRPEALWRPELRPGDALLFTPYTVHRTWLASQMRQTRLSYELRLISLQDQPLTRSPVIPWELAQ
ncbi:MAG: hypothetical protein CVV27_16475 [Candidatus Melainabacteria bacterium HGW-Melainabacteria-1]|nr:MAG: hypothetical protein CVV27_16475 [Candidatus Melainabacteria bacterium HGW-Melainabacteria-1]